MILKLKMNSRREDLETGVEVGVEDRDGSRRGLKTKEGNNGYEEKGWGGRGM